MPRHRSRALPKRSTCVPPALVARLPPIVQLPSAARLSANSEPPVGCRLLRCLEHAAGFERDRRVGDVDRTHAIHAGQAQQHLAAAVIGHAAAHQPGVAALRDDADARGRACTHHLCHLVGAAGAHDCERLAAPTLAPIELVGRQVAVGQHLGNTDSTTQRVEQRGAHGAPWRCAPSPEGEQAPSERPGGAHRPGAGCARLRMCSTQATKSSPHSSSSSQANCADTPRSVAARIAPSATYSHTSRLSARTLASRHAQTPANGHASGSTLSASARDAGGCQPQLPRQAEHHQRDQQRQQGRSRCIDPRAVASARCQRRVRLTWAGMIDGMESAYAPTTWPAHLSARGARYARGRGSTPGTRCASVLPKTAWVSRPAA